MQRTRCTQRCHQLRHFKHSRVSALWGFQSQRHRRFASRQPPSFGSSIPSSRNQIPKFGAGKPSPKKQKPSGKNPPSDVEKPKSRRKLPIGPGKIFLFSLFAYIGYKVYQWDTNPKRSNILNPKNFTPFILETRDRVSSTSSILNLKSLPKGQNTDNVTEAWKTGIWSVQAMQPELQIARSYTPLPPAENAEPEELRLFVRKEPQGEVSSFLHRIFRGTLVHLRGPHIEYEVPEHVEEVLFLAGGTGIAPALQLAHILYNYRTSTSDSGPRLRILWANRHREDSYSKHEALPAKQVSTDRWQSQQRDGAGSNSDEANVPPSQPQTALVAEVESLKTRYPGKVEVDYFVDEENSHITGGVLRQYLSNTNEASKQVFQGHQTGKKLLLISGPEGFVDYYAGPKSMRGGKELQGPLGGALQQMYPQGWEIWKL